MIGIFIQQYGAFLFGVVIGVTICSVKNFEEYSGIKITWSNEE